MITSLMTHVLVAKHNFYFTMFNYRGHLCITKICCGPWQTSISQLTWAPWNKKRSLEHIPKYIYKHVAPSWPYVQYKAKFKNKIAQSFNFMVYNGSIVHMQNISGLRLFHGVEQMSVFYFNSRYFQCWLSLVGD